MKCFGVFFGRFLSVMMVEHIHCFLKTYYFIRAGLG